jgi:hypothetical protein
MGAGRRHNTVEATPVKPLTVSQIDQLRKLLKRASKPASPTPAERGAARAAKVTEYKATVLAWAVADWHERAARLKISCPDLWRLGTGECPDRYTPHLGERYKRRNQFNY